MALFKRKASPKEPSEERPKKLPKFKGLSIGKILGAGFLVIAIITLLGAYSSYILYAERIDDNLDDQHSAIAERAAAVIATRLDALNQQVNRILNSVQIQLALNELPAGELAPPAILKAQLTAQLPELIRQVIIDGETPTNDQIHPPLSYACLELPDLKKPILELHLFGNADQHLDIAFPIANSRSLLLSFDINLMRQWLSTIDSGNSYIQLQQQIDNAPPLTYAQTGNSQLAGSSNSVTRPIPATQSQISVTPPITEPLSQIERILFFVNFGVVLLLIALTLWGTLIAVRIILNRDLRTLGSLLQHSAASLHHILPIKLAELRGCAEEIKKQLGVDDGVAVVAADTDTVKKVKDEISPLFQSDITVDVEPEDSEDNQPTDSPK